MFCAAAEYDVLYISRYLFLFRGQKYLIRFSFKWLCLFFMEKDRAPRNAREGKEQIVA